MSENFCGEKGENDKIPKYNEKPCCTNRKMDLESKESKSAINLRVRTTFLLIKID